MIPRRGAEPSGMDSSEWSGKTMMDRAVEDVRTSGGSSWLVDEALTKC